MNEPWTFYEIMQNAACMILIYIGAYSLARLITKAIARSFFEERAKHYEYIKDRISKTVNEILSKHNKGEEENNVNE